MTRRTRQGFAAFATVALSTACELVAQLHGERSYQSPAASAGSDYRGGGTSVSDAGSGANTSEGGNVGSAGEAAHSGSTVEGGKSSAAAGDGAGDGGSTSGTDGACNAGASAEDDGELLSTPSCTGLVASGCGQVQPCQTLLVPGGTFKMGRNQDGTRADYFPTGAGDEVPEHVVTVGPYWLDKYEVTVGRFRRFVEAYDGTPPSNGAGANPRVLESGWHSEWNVRLPVDGADLRASLSPANPTENLETSTWTASPGAGECRPMNQISWYLAFAFCIWDGGRLPSEAEWEYAAAGGDQERLYPWGSARADSRAVFDCSYSGGLSCTAGDLPHVGSICAAWNGRFHHADLAGSLGEMTRDDYSPQFYSLEQATGSDVTNLAFTGTTDASPTRGGSYNSPGSSIRSAQRSQLRHSDRARTLGVRCARDQ